MHVGFLAGLGLVSCYVWLMKIEQYTSNLLTLLLECSKLPLFSFTRRKEMQVYVFIFL